MENPFSKFSYDTLSEAVEALEKRGYTYDFNLEANGITHSGGRHAVSPDAFEVQEVYRFEGMTSTDDEAVVYAIETKNGLKGTLIDAYGTYADSLTPEMIQKLTYPKG